MPIVKFLKEKKEVQCEAGANLREVAQANGVEVYQGISKTLNCGGRSTCGTCLVHIKKGMDNCSPPGLLEKARFAVSFLNIGHEDEARLSCQVIVNGDIEVQTTPAFNWSGEAETPKYPWPPRSRGRVRPGTGHPNDAAV
jgi:2Fe-2S ferredoxin